MCQPCDGPTSVTANPASEKSAEGVSLENVLSPDFLPPKDYSWYYLRVSYGRAEKLYEQLKGHTDGYFLWLPYEKHVRYENGKKLTSWITMFKRNIFIFSTYKQALGLTHRSPEGYPYVDFAFDHTKQNMYGRDRVIEIPFWQMQNFARAVEVHHPWAHIVEEEKLHFRPGGKVRVTGGSFEGVEGYVARVFGQTRVIVTIKGIVNYATAYVSQKYLQPVDEYIEQHDSHPEAGNSTRNRVLRHEVKIGVRIPDDKRKKK